MRRRDLNAVAHLLEGARQPSARHHCVNAVTGQTVDLRETVEMHQGVAPPLVGEEIVRSGAVAEKVAIGLVDDQGTSRLPCHLEKTVDDVRWIDRARRVVRRDENDGPRPRADQAAGIVGVRHTATVRAKTERHGGNSQHAGRHLVIEVPGHGKDDLVPLPRQGQHGVEERLVAPGGDHDVARTDVTAIKSVDVVCQGWPACRRCRCSGRSIRRAPARPRGLEARQAEGTRGPPGRRR